MFSDNISYPEVWLAAERYLDLISDNIAELEGPIIGVNKYNARAIANLLALLELGYIFNTEPNARTKKVIMMNRDTGYEHTLANSIKLPKRLAIKPKDNQALAILIEELLSQYLYDLQDYLLELSETNKTTKKGRDNEKTN